MLWLSIDLPCIASTVAITCNYLYRANQSYVGMHASYIDIATT